VADYIHVEGDQRVPSSITLFAATGGRWNKIALPEGLSPARQLAVVPDLIGEYLKRYGGFCPFFGRVVGFRLVHSQEESYRFDLDGVLIERIDGAFIRPHAELRIGHQTASSLFPLCS
jgi:hypothetical protein